ncbi:calcium permeable stress-gated cation channel 1 [Trichomonascus vanleenenianus]|uniref:Csc1p n=1 Tax=Trichomonascus vanleenenianus TaxID=2268995 RepID=UPI003EC955B5
MPPDDGHVYSPPDQRVLSTQILIAAVLGVSALGCFSVLRYKLPRLYAARRSRHKGLPRLSNSLFGWLKSLYDISEEDVLEHAGLDAFVFLGFFKMSIQLLSICTLCAVTIIGPIRLHFTGNYDQGDDDDDDGYFSFLKRQALDLDSPEPEDYDGYLWVYVVFTYVFTALTLVYLLRQTLKVIRVRQEYLGRQNSITDRTIRLSGITPDLRTTEALKEHIESLGIGTVRSINLCRNWAQLDELFDQRIKVIRKLERAWSEYLGPTWVNNHTTEEDRLPLADSYASLATSGTDEEGEHVSLLASTNGTLQLRGTHAYNRPTERVGWWSSERIDIIDKYSNELEFIDEQIKYIRDSVEFPATGTAFVTMDSVASAQMTAQALLDPTPHKLLAATAPAPHDVVWRNLYMSPRERMARMYSITVIIAILSVAMVYPVYSLTKFLEFDSIKRFWPGLAELLEKSPWAHTFVTGILPPLVYTLFNFIMPYIYVYLSGLQGYVSYGEVELSIISKNFFYVFVNMFLVFTVGASSYWAYLKDTTQIAYKLARTLRKLSLFYVDLIILQGLGMFPFRLLQIGSIVRLPVFAAHARSPRDYRELYKPAIFNYGIHLPQPILIFIIVLLYSVISSKILAFGTLYFICGYFTYKYQLMYSMVHPQHSTGRAWPLIFRRICLGLVIFHLAMAGILALQHAYFLATMLTPLPFIIFAYWYNFEDNYAPLLKYIALRAIETSGSNSAGSVLEETASESHGLLRRARSQSKTLDEQRERFQTYVNPNLTRPLDGPWIGIEGDEVILANSEGTRRRRMRFEEWE